MKVNLNLKWSLFTAAGVICTLTPAFHNSGPMVVSMLTAAFFLGVASLCILSGGDS